MGCRFYLRRKGRRWRGYLHPLRNQCQLGLSLSRRRARTSCRRDPCTNRTTGVILPQRTELRGCPRPPEEHVSALRIELLATKLFAWVSPSRSSRPRVGFPSAPSTRGVATSSVCAGVPALAQTGRP